MSELTEDQRSEDIEDAEDIEDQEPADQPAGWQDRRPLVIIAATLTVLLLGATVGMLITFAMVDKTRPPSATSVDVGFAQDMQVHHLQAVTMAGIVRDETTDQELKQLAFDIERTQLGQIGAMAGWLTVWGQPELPQPGAGHMKWMPSTESHLHGDSSGGVTTMPGMASSEELNRLRKLSGRAQDVLFLQLMIRHHQGGLNMARYAAEHAEESYVRNLAQKMVDGQAAEIELMTDMLAERDAKPLPFPG